MSATHQGWLQLPGQEWEPAPGVEGDDVLELGDRLDALARAAGAERTAVVPFGGTPGGETPPGRRLGLFVWEAGREPPPGPPAEEYVGWLGTRTRGFVERCRGIDCTDVMAQTLATMLRVGLREMEVLPAGQAPGAAAARGGNTTGAHYLDPESDDTPR